MDFIPLTEGGLLEAPFVPMIAGPVDELEEVEEPPESDAEKGIDVGIEEREQLAYLRGFSDGEREASLKLNKEFGEQVAILRDLFTSLSLRIDRELHEFFGEIEEKSVKLAIAVSEKIIRKEVSLHPEIIRCLLSNAISKWKSRGMMKVKLNPEEKSLAGELFKELRSQLLNMEIEFDPQVERSGFVIETEKSSIDHTISGQLERIESELVRLYGQDRPGYEGPHRED